MPERIDPTANFRHELKSLRDQVLAAIDASAIGDVEDGLELYGRLTAATLQTFNDLQRRTGVQPASSWFNPYGQEMEWLETDIRTFVDRVFASFNEGVFEALVHFLVELLTDFWEANELGAHGRFLGIMQRAYWDALGIPSGSDRATASILTVIRSHGAYRLAYAGPQFSDEVVAQALTQVIDFLFEAFRLSVTRSTLAAARCATEVSELKEALQFAKQRTSSHHSALDTALRRLDAYALGATGFVLLLNEMSELGDEPAKLLVDRLAAQLSVEDLWAAVVETAEDTPGSQGYPWSSWETSLWPAEKRGGVLGRLRDAMNEAVALRLLMAGRHSVDDDSLDELEPSQAAWIVQNVVEKVDEARLRYSVLHPEAVQPDATALAEALGGLKSRLDERDQARRDQLDLDAKKVDLFLSAAEEAWRAPSPLRSSTAEEIAVENPPDLLFGHSSLVPKDFFTDSRVYADPADMGRNFGNGLARGESVRIVDQLMALPHPRIRLSQVRAHVSAAIDELRRDGFEPHVFAVNSWRVTHALTGSYDSSDIEFDGARVSVDYAGDVQLCVVADLRRAVLTRRWAMTATDPGDQLLADGLLVGGVRDVTDEVASQLIEGNEEFRRADDGSLLSDEDARRKLRNRVIAKLFSKLTIELTEPRAARVFSVNENE